MPKFSVNATELTNTDVNFVALVKRGANRIPFRITKSEEENDMIDLHKIGRRLFKTAEPRPAIVAVYARKGADLATITAALKSVGLDVSTFEKSDEGGNTTLIRKSDEAPEDVVLVKMDGGVTLAISHVSKAFSSEDFSSPNFGEVHAKGTHMASMALATDSLHHTLGNIIQNADSPKDAASQMADACEAHKAHVAKLTQSLPVQAFKADQAIIKAELALLMKGPMPDPRKHPHANVAMAIAHAAHQAALTAQSAGEMISGGGADDDQQTGPPPVGQNNGMQKSSDGDKLSDEGDPGAEDPLMPKKTATGTNTVDAQKADAGKNGTGAGAELGEGTGADDRATQDDANNTEVNATGDENVSGTDTGLPAKAKAPTKKAALAKAQLAVAKAELALLLAKDDEIEDDDSTNGTQMKLPAKVKSPTSTGSVTKVDGAGGSHTIDVTSEKVTGEGDEQAIFDGGGDEETLSAQARCAADDAANAGGKVAGKIKGKTLSLEELPGKLISPTTKNDGDAEIGKKGKGNQLDEGLSGSGAQERDALTTKSGELIMKALQAMSKSVQESIAAVTKSVGELNARVDQVATVAKKNDAALNGTVFSEARGDNVRNIKSDAGVPPLLDTAYSRRTA